MRRLEHTARDPHISEADERARHLARDARARAQSAGHALGRFKWDEWDGRAHCERCDAFVSVRLKRRVDELEVWGTALVTPCTPHRGRA